MTLGNNRMKFPQKGDRKRGQLMIFEQNTLPPFVKPHVKGLGKTKQKVGSKMSTTTLSKTAANNGMFKNFIK